VLTREEVWADQIDLERLCHDRALETVETNTSNAFYGHADILKRVAGVPSGRALSVTIPHGVSFAGPNLTEAHSTHATGYSYQRELDDAMSQHGSRALIRGAAPFTYVPHLVSTAVDARRGTLYFPAHSTRFTSVDAAYDAMADVLAALPAEWQPVRVCCYYMDILRGNHRPFLKRGIPVVSAGHMYDPHFLFRLWHLLSCHERAASNSHGSHTPYAIFAGCRYSYMPIGPVTVRCERGYEDWWEGPRPDSADLLASVFPAHGAGDADTRDGAERGSMTASFVANDLLGLARRLTPLQLASALSAADRRQRRRSAE
jgi:hypothetical protein